MKTDAVDAVDRCLETLDAEFGGGLSFRCVGPTAPTSFATVEIEFLEADEIAQASRTLEVDLTASPADVRFAYRRLAREGPSRHGGCPRGRQRSDGGVDESLQVSVAIRARTRVRADRQRAALPRFRCCASCACLGPEAGRGERRRCDRWVSIGALHVRCRASHLCLSNHPPQELPAGARTLNGLSADSQYGGVVWRARGSGEQSSGRQEAQQDRRARRDPASRQGHRPR